MTQITHAMLVALNRALPDRVGILYPAELRVAVEAMFSAAPTPADDTALEGLRELSERATAGYWSAAPAIPGAKGMFYLSGNHDANNREVDIGTVQGGSKSCEANARLIVACVNYVRTELERTKGSGQ